MANQKTSVPSEDIFANFQHYLETTTDPLGITWAKTIDMLYVVIDWIHKHVEMCPHLDHNLNHDDKTSDIVMSQLFRVLMGPALQDGICRHEDDKIAVQHAIEEGDVNAIKLAFKQYLASEDHVLDLSCREAMVRQTMVECAANNENY